MAGVIDLTAIIQIGLIVKDVETTKQKWAEFLGVPVPPTFDSGDYKITQTVYKGEGAPKAACKMAFFKPGANIELELIEPNGEKSVWQDFLDEKGEGIHHIAFKAQGTDKALEKCEKSGYKCMQRGKYGDGGGEYAYLDSEKDLKCIVEFLESYN